MTGCWWCDQEFDTKGRWPVRYLRRDIGKRVVVQLDDVVWSGTLSACGRDHLELSGAAAGVVGPTAADGRIIIPALQVHYVQVLA